MAAPSISECNASAMANTNTPPPLVDVASITRCDGALDIVDVVVIPSSPGDDMTLVRTCEWYNGTCCIFANSTSETRPTPTPTPTPTATPGEFEFEFVLALALALALVFVFVLEDNDNIVSPSSTCCRCLAERDVGEEAPRDEAGAAVVVRRGGEGGIGGEIGGGIAEEEEVEEEVDTPNPPEAAPPSNAVVADVIPVPRRDSYVRRSSSRLSSVSLRHSWGVVGVVGFPPTGLRAALPPRPTPRTPSSPSPTAPGVSE